MKNRNRWPTSHTTPRHDPILLAIQAAVAVLLVVALTQFVPTMHRVIGLADLHCPAPDHAVWASTLGPWYWKGEALCGDSLTAGVKAK